MAADAGGNVEGTVAGEVVKKHGVTIVGASNLARSLAADASALFARNLYNFLGGLLGQGSGGADAPGRRRDRTGRIRLTHNGKVVKRAAAAMNRPSLLGRGRGWVPPKAALSSRNPPLISPP